MSRSYRCAGVVIYYRDRWHLYTWDRVGERLEKLLKTALEKPEEF